MASLLADMAVVAFGLFLIGLTGVVFAVGLFAFGALLLFGVLSAASSGEV